MKNTPYKEAETLRTLKRNAKDNVKNCNYCNANYVAQRSTSRYCSNTCRSRAWKKEENATYVSKLDKLRKLYDELLQLHGGIKGDFRFDETDYLYELDDYPFSWILEEINMRRKFSLDKSDIDTIYRNKFGEHKKGIITWQDVVNYLH